MKFFADIKEQIAKKTAWEKRIDKRSILISWFISYLAVLIIPLIGNFAISMYIKSVLKTEITAAHELKLKILKDNVDNFFFESERLANETFFSEDVARLAQAQSFDGELRYSAKVIGDDLQHRLIASMKNMKSYMYFPESDYILSSGMLIESSQFYDAYYAKSGYTYGEWLDNLKMQGQHTYSVNSEYNIDGNGVSIENIRSVQMIGKSSEKTAVLVTMISRDSLFDKVQLDNDFSSVLISDGNGNLLMTYGYSYGDGILGEIKAEGYAKSVKYNGEKLIASCIDSDWGDMQYIYVLKAETFNRKILNTWAIVLLSLILSIACAAAVIYFAMIRNYRPVRGLMDMMKKLEEPKDSGKNEYIIMKNTIAKLIEQSNSNATALRKNEEILVRVYMLRAVMEKRQSMEMRRKLEDLGIIFKKPYFEIAILKIEKLGQLSGEIFGSTDDMTLAKYAVHNITNELMSRHFVSGVCETNDTVIFVVNTDGSDESRRLLKQDIKEAQSELEKHLSAVFYAAVSGTGDSFEDLNELYCDALYALEYGTAIGADIMDYSDMGDIDETMECSMSKWNELCSCIRLRDTVAADEIIDDIIKESFEESNTPITAVKRGFAYMLVSMVMHTASEAGNLNNDIMRAGVACIKEQTESFNIIRLKSAVKELSRMACGTTGRKEENSITLSDDIIKYIEENYSNYDLNITMIGRALGLTASYVSKMFLNQTGTKLLDYISIYRVEKAKEILVTSPDIKIERVGEMVGFSVNRSFLRTFKKYVGVTPGAYRDGERKVSEK